VAGWLSVSPPSSLSDMNHRFTFSPISTRWRSRPEAHDASGSDLFYFTVVRRVSPLFPDQLLSISGPAVHTRRAFYAVFSLHLGESIGTFDQDQFFQEPFALTQVAFWPASAVKY
jgi:hypothetical protein